MAGLLNFEIDDLLGRKKRARREVEAGVLSRQLLQDGDYTPPEVNAIASHYLETGEFKSPTHRTKMLEADPESGVASRSTQVPISFKKKKGLFKMDSRSGKMDQVETPDDMEDFEVKSYNDDVGHSWKIDRATGERVDMGPNGKSFDTYIYWNSKTGQGSGGSAKDTPEVALAKDTVRKYQDAKKRGDPLTDEFIEGARNAFELLQIPIDEAEEDPTFPEKVRNKVSTMTKGKVAPAEKRYSDPIPDFDKSSDALFQKDLADARRYIALNKNTPNAKSEAINRLQKKWGRRAKSL